MGCGDGWFTKLLGKERSMVRSEIRTFFVADPDQSEVHQDPKSIYFYRNVCSGRKSLNVSFKVCVMRTLFLDPTVICNIEHNCKFLVPGLKVFVTFKVFFNKFQDYRIFLLF